MKKNIIIIFIFILFFIILTEKLNLEIIFLGGIVSLIVYKLNFPGKEKTFPLNKIPFKLFYLTKYLLILIKEIVIANFHVAKIVISKTPDISPTIVEFNTKLKNDLNKTILANSITLTPGTLTLGVNGDTFRVHCLKREYEDGLKNSKFEEILLKLEEC